MCVGVSERRIWEQQVVAYVPPVFTVVWVWNGVHDCNSRAAAEPFVSPAGNQLLLITEESMRVESHCALAAAAEGSIAACRWVFVKPALMECAQQCVLSVIRTELLWFFCFQNISFHCWSLFFRILQGVDGVCFSASLKRFVYHCTHFHKHKVHATTSPPHQNHILST